MLVRGESTLASKFSRAALAATSMAAAREVNRGHVDTKVGDRFDRARYGVGDVMQLKVEGPHIALFSDNTAGPAVVKS